jgi:FkbM family methyltransferase
MSFVSYSQNLEDVMLWRALRGITKGFYVDVGANDPVVDSVTKAFYDLGWHGINIEPIKRHWEELCRQRPHDVNLLVATGAQKGNVEIFDTEIRGWATVDVEVRAKIEKAGIAGQSYFVEERSLTDILDESSVSVIHFLKVDVEGFEEEVLQGMDFDKYRPWIVVVEATRPNTQELAYQNWEPTLTEHNYDFAYFDGLNRFYIAGERADLKSSFLSPPNVFDDYVRADYANALERLNKEIAETGLLREKADLQSKAAEAAREEAHKWWLASGELDGHLKVANANLESKSSEILSLRAEYEARGRELAGTQSELAQAKGQLEATRVDVEAAREEAHKWWLSCGDLEKQLKTAREEAHKWWLNSGDLENQLKAAREEAQNWRLSADQLTQEIASLRRSKSWRLTAPLRLIAHIIRWLVRRVKKLVKKILKFGIKIILKLPLVGWLVRKLGKRFLPQVARRWQARKQSEQVEQSHNNEPEESRVELALWKPDAVASSVGSGLAGHYWQDIMNEVQNQEHAN